MAHLPDRGRLFLPCDCIDLTVFPQRDRHYCRRALSRPEVERELLGMARQAHQLAVSRITESTSSVHHSRWERFKHWADEHPLKLWFGFWAVLVPVAIVIVVMFP
jgi:hypothetical protein